jgi:serine/threonine protein kinase
VAGLLAGQAAEKAINLFGLRIVERWLPWLRQLPRETQLAAVSGLADLVPEVARGEAAAALEQQAPQASPADRQAAVEYLGAIPRSVRRSLLSDRERGGRALPPTVTLDHPLSLLALLPADLPPYSVPCSLPGTEYQLEELLGSGGFGAVYRASGPSLQHLPLAIKFCLDGSLLPALQQERANLERLMKAGGESWSPRLVRLYGYNLEHRTPYLVYEYVSGGDLVRWLAARRARDGRGLTPGEVLELITQVAEALAFAHQRGLVHRDLKPANVLMEGGAIKLADFGIGGLAARQAGQVSRIGSVSGSRLSPAEQASLFRGAGTPLYMSKEQRDGQEPDPRHDLYSLGVMWYQLLVGDVSRELHPGWAEELIEEHGVPAGQVEMIKQCVGLLKRRPENAARLLDTLRGLAGAEVTPRLDKPQVQPVAAQREPPLSGSTAGALREELIEAIIETGTSPEGRNGRVLAVFSSLILALVFTLMGFKTFLEMSVTGITPSQGIPVKEIAVIIAAILAVSGGLLFTALAIAAARSLGRLVGSHRKRTREALIHAIDTAKNTLSLAVIPFDPDNSESLCQAGLHLASDIQKRHLPRNTSARVRRAGFGTRFLDPGWGKYKVVLDGEFLGEGSYGGGCDLPAKLCRGRHYLELNWPSGKQGSWFDIPHDGNCLVEIRQGGEQVEVFWTDWT